MYRFAIVATLFAVSAGTLAELDRGGVRKSSDRVKAVCDSVYKDIRARERDSRLDSDEFARQLLLSLASASNGDSDSEVRVIDLSNLDKYRVKEEPVGPNSGVVRRGMFGRLGGLIGRRPGMFRPAMSRPAMPRPPMRRPGGLHPDAHHAGEPHSNRPWIGDIDISVINQQPDTSNVNQQSDTGNTDQQPDAGNADGAPMMRFLDTDGKDFLPVSSRSLGTETNAVKTVDSTNGISVLPDYKILHSKPRRLKGRGKKRHHHSKTRGHKLSKKQRTQPKGESSGVTTSSNEPGKLAATTERSSVAIETTVSNESPSKVQAPANKPLESQPMKDASKTRKAMWKWPVDVELDELPTWPIEPSTLETEATRRYLNRNTNVNKNVNAIKAHRETKGSNELQSIVGNNRRSAIGDSPQLRQHRNRHENTNANVNSNTNVYSYGSDDRDEDDTTPNVRRSLPPFRRALARFVDEDGERDNGNYNTNSNVNSNVMGLETVPKPRRGKTVKRILKRATTRQPPTRGEAIVQSLA